MTRHALLAALAAGAISVAATDTRAAILYSGGTYSQDFDSLPISPENVSLGTAATNGWRDDTASPAPNVSIVGWYLYHSTAQSEGGFNEHQRLRITSGNTTTGSFYSFGTTSSTERALGNIGSSTTMAAGGQIVYGARFTNNTGTTLTEFTLDYIVEQWRDGGTATTGSVSQSVPFGYKITDGGTGLIEDTGFTDVAALGYSSPTFGATAGTPLDGNLPANQQVKGPVTVPVTWLPGEDLWIRWSDTDHPSADHGLAIDSLNFSAIPEPAGVALLALGAACLIRRRGAK